VIEPLHVGEEAFVNYGSDYFDSRYEGNNKDDFLDIQPSAAQDTDMKIYIALLHPLLTTYSHEALQRGLKILCRALPPPPDTMEDWETWEGWKTEGREALSARLFYIMLLVLERFGYTKDWFGFVKIAKLASSMYFDKRTTVATQRLSNQASALLSFLISFL